MLAPLFRASNIAQNCPQEAEQITEHKQTAREHARAYRGMQGAYMNIISRRPHSRIMFLSGSTRPGAAKSNSHITVILPNRKTPKTARPCYH